MKKIEHKFQEINKGDVVLDIGANVGEYTEIFNDLVGPSGRVHAFEPFVLSFLKLLDRELKNVICYNLAIGDKIQEVKLWLSDVGNKQHCVYGCFDKKKHVSAVMCTIDNIIPYADFVKIDVEGVEPLVFKGMKKLIKSNKNIKIICEINESLIKKAELDYNKFIKYIYKNFNVEELEEKNFYLTKK